MCNCGSTRRIASSGTTRRPQTQSSPTISGNIQISNIWKRILNNDGLPLNVVPLSTLSWQESIKLVYLDRAIVIASYADWVVHSPSMSFNVPSIILLNEYIKVSKSTKYSKENI